MMLHLCACHFFFFAANGGVQGAAADDITGRRLVLGLAPPTANGVGRETSSEPAIGGGRGPHMQRSQLGTARSVRAEVSSGRGFIEDQLRGKSSRSGREAARLGWCFAGVVVQYHPAGTAAVGRRGKRGCIKPVHSHMTGDRQRLGNETPRPRTLSFDIFRLSSHGQAH